MPSKVSDAVVKGAEETAVKKSVPPLTRLQTLKTPISMEKLDVVAGTPSALAKGPELPSSKPTHTQRENAVVINTKTYPEEKNVYASDSDPDYNSEQSFTSLDSDESSDTDDDKEFVEYTLIERILIFLGFLEDHQARRDDSSDSDSDEDGDHQGGGIFTRVYGGATAAVKTVASAATSAAKVVTRTAPRNPKTEPAAAKETESSNKKGKTKGYKKKKKKKKNAKPNERLTAEELKEKIERRKKALEAQKERRARRAAIRAARAKAREKAERRINRYKFDPEQDIVKLRFKAFGNHARVIM